MGNFLKDKNGNIAIPDTAINIIADSNLLSPNIKNYIKLWEQAGFTFNFLPSNQNDVMNKKMQERSFVFSGTNSTYIGMGVSLELNTEAKPLVYTQRLHPTQFSVSRSPSVIKIDFRRMDILQADIVHELGHALGLAHEHQRYDRKNHALPTNNYNEARKNKQQVSRSYDFVPFGDYDVDSVMHYPGLFVNKCNNEQIGVVNSSIVFPNTLSKKDILSARFLFNEARINERLIYLENQHESSSSSLLSNYSFLNDSKSICFNPATISKFRELQSQRLETLNNGKSDIITKTLDAINNQQHQLKCLGMTIENIDEMLFQSVNAQVYKATQVRER